ncbi:hypothetical protein NQ176_g1287 [Zarea fungicola]|uniref:Uncharacterized protein n=1 Tax=Zarea fungicola TaxID=93591 RepID=A0ACC1NTG7_9HYPO|nr:hypothetical protein NQ176_g1287 [Lecanicillium fungicola]
MENAHAAETSVVTVQDIPNGTESDAEITVRRLRMAGKKRGDKGESPEQRGRDANDQTVSTTSVTNDPLTVEEPPLPSGQQQKSAIDEGVTEVTFGHTPTQHDTCEENHGANVQRSPVDAPGETSSQDSAETCLFRPTNSPESKQRDVNVAFWEPPSEDQQDNPAVREATRKMRKWLKRKAPSADPSQSYKNESDGSTTNDNSASDDTGDTDETDAGRPSKKQKNVSLKEGSIPGI